MTPAAATNAATNAASSATTPGALSTQERELLEELLQRSRAVFVAEMMRVDAADWATRPAGAGWSVAECAEHVTVSEQALRALVRGLPASPARPEIAAALRGKDGAVVQAMRDRTRRAKTFHFLEPTGRWAGRDAVLAEFERERAATIEYVRTTPDPLHVHVAPLEPLGDLDGYQWLLLLALHTERHAAQAASTRADLSPSA
jgi:hypothetical protein